MSVPSHQLLNRNPDEFTVAERRALAGRWIALPLYSPTNLALRRIAAIADSPAACLAQLRESGQDPKDFECRLMPG